MQQSKQCAENKKSSFILIDAKVFVNCKMNLYRFNSQGALTSSAYHPLFIERKIFAKTLFKENYSIFMFQTFRSKTEEKIYSLTAKVSQLFVK